MAVGQLPTACGLSESRRPTVYWFMSLANPAPTVGVKPKVMIAYKRCGCSPPTPAELTISRI